MVSLTREIIVKVQVEIRHISDINKLYVGRKEIIAQPFTVVLHQEANLMVVLLNAHFKNQLLCLGLCVRDRGCSPGTQPIRTTETTASLSSGHLQRYQVL